MEEIKVRELQVNDVFAMGRILAKASQRSKNLLTGLMADQSKLKGEAGEALKSRIYMETAMSVVSILFGEAESDIKAFLASMIEKPPSEFDKLPAKALPEIIRQLVQKEDIKDFFSQAWSWVGQNIEKTSSEGSMLSSTDTAGGTVISIISNGEDSLSS